MKSIIATALFSIITQLLAAQATCRNVIIVTIDGVRWQEVYQGAQYHELTHCTTQLPAQLYWDSSITVRRKLLMPFVWGSIQHQGQLWGNRGLGNYMQVKNKVKLSYTGYNEMLTGKADNTILTNKPKLNKHKTVLEYLHQLPAFNDSVAIFASWSRFHHILRTQVSNLYVNAGNEATNAPTHTQPSMQAPHSHNKVYSKHTTHTTRNEVLTYLAAIKHMAAAHPKVLYIGFGQADEYAHNKDYTQYLNSIHTVDSLVAQLWGIIQCNTYYKHNTVLIITTDHGRGSSSHNWHKHGMLVSGSNHTWLASIGNCILPTGERVTSPITYTAQVASTIAQLLGTSYMANNAYSSSIVPQLLGR